MNRFLLICLGGAAGIGARYLTALWASAVFGPSFPAGTLFFELAGLFLLGFLMQISITRSRLSSDVGLMLTIVSFGVLGGFTAYSTFNYETTKYFREGAWLTGASNIATTLAVCLVAGLTGTALADRLVGR